ncbi:MAG: hypothetical protein PHV30_05815 [Candidatus Margulisbacteria bacterium]|nr:hypothetical protein [Candidatus Margulisiibacteriota bacterium]
MKKIDLLIVAAEKYEIYPLLKICQRQNIHFYLGKYEQKSFAVFITGVGKKSLQRNFKQFFPQDKYSFKQIVNVGNAGAIKDYFSGTIIRVGIVYGENGKHVEVVEKNNSFSLVTVNSLQKKARLAKQYPSADLVDMEAYHLLKIFPNMTINFYKIVLDTFTINPEQFFFRCFLFFKIAKNTKKICGLLTEKYLKVN